ncbi:MAG: hypothetical protein Q8O67_31705 [Deltaproteobacteria bacterium]|nr:hypothetical protein [Deltaproteobacteria bacterium]
MDTDPVNSHDVEDIITVLRGSSALVDEVRNGTGAVHDAVRSELRAMVERNDALEIFQGHVEGDEASVEAASRLLTAIRRAVAKP